MFAVNGILFNHESERRGENFVTRKITLVAGRIAEGLQDHLELGSMDWFPENREKAVMVEQDIACELERKMKWIMSMPHWH